MVVAKAAERRWIPVKIMTICLTDVELAMLLAILSAAAENMDRHGRLDLSRPLYRLMDTIGPNSVEPGTV